MCRIDFWNFLTINVFAVKESIASISTGLPCLGDLENPGGLPVQDVLGGSGDCVLSIFEISSLFMFLRSGNPLLTFLLTYHVWMTSKIKVTFRFKRFSKLPKYSFLDKNALNWYAIARKKNVWRSHDQCFIVTSCHVMSQQATSFHVMPRHATSRHVTSCQVMSCHVMSRTATSSHVISRHATPCHVMSCHVTSRQVVMSIPVTSWHVLACHVTSYHATSCHVMSHHVMPRHVTSCHVMSRWLSGGCRYHTSSSSF